MRMGRGRTACDRFWEKLPERWENLGERVLRGPRAGCRKSKHAPCGEGFRSQATGGESQGALGPWSEVRVWRVERKRRGSGVDCEKEGSCPVLRQGDKSLFKADR